MLLLVVRMSTRIGLRVVLIIVNVTTCTFFKFMFYSFSGIIKPIREAIINYQEVRPLPVCALKECSINSYVPKHFSYKPRTVRQMIQKLNMAMYFET